MIRPMTPFRFDSHFAECLKELRRRTLGKQACLSYAVGCTDAAVSLWESGKRLPHEGMISRILGALGQGGASASELSNLLDTWQRAKGVRTNRAA